MAIINAIEGRFRKEENFFFEQTLSTVEEEMLALKFLAEKEAVLHIKIKDEDSFAPVGVSIGNGNLSLFHCGNIDKAPISLQAEQSEILAEGLQVDSEYESLNLSDGNFYLSEVLDNFDYKHCLSLRRRDQKTPSILFGFSSCRQLSAFMELVFLEIYGHVSK